jgi:DEAD/DEAH box helicase domain-containing protein
MYVVFDVETKKIFEEIGDGDISQLGISYLAYYRSDTDSIEGLFEDRVPEFKKIMDSADLIIGYNIIGFDNPVLKGYFDFEDSKYNFCDLYKIIYKQHNVYIKLDNITSTTLGAGKIAHGLDAIRFYREGNLDKLKEYCDSDVQLTRDIYEFIKKNGHFFYTDGLGQKQKLELDLSGVEEQKVVAAANDPLDGGFGLF